MAHCLVDDSWWLLAKRGKEKGKRSRLPLLQVLKMELNETEGLWSLGSGSTSAYPFCWFPDDEDSLSFSPLGQSLRERLF
ncbi:mCG146951 [Mus musculus]|jgi:hypothetical protein|nr:mCG146951 [Mus musculus]